MSAEADITPFYACLTDVSLKLPLILMEYPIFSLSKKKTTEPIFWTNSNYGLKLAVNPTRYGRANMYDLDTLIYLSSQLIAARNNGIPTSRRIKTHVASIVNLAKQGNGGCEATSVLNSLKRLKSTFIETNIPSGSKIYDEGFSLIETYLVCSCPITQKMLHIEITLSQWLYAEIMSPNIKTIHRDYFKIRSMNNRRLYLLTHKHLGNQKYWPISEYKLHLKHGSQSNIYAFRHYLKNTKKILDIKFDYSQENKVIAKRSMLSV